MVLEAAAAQIHQQAPARRLARLRAALRSPWAPRLALCLLLAFTIAAKAIDINQPCEAPCKPRNKHTLIFDEQYYVNAARVIDGIEPPQGDPYHGAPKGEDPNAEHPQLAKLIIAGGIRVFGDTPLGWRIGSILFAAVALLALYALVLGGGGSAWLAVGTCAVMSLDNLMLVHGRIGTLDIYAVAMMLVAGALYVRDKPILAGLALGVAACMKEVSLALVFVFVLLEALMLARTWWLPKARASDVAAASAAELEGGAHRSAPARDGEDSFGVLTQRLAGDGQELRLGRPSEPVSEGAQPSRSAEVTEGGRPRVGGRPLTGGSAESEPARRRAVRLGLFLLTGAGATLGLLWLLDVLVPAYDPGTHAVYAGNPIRHLLHMYNYAQLLKSKPGETGIASPPLAWLLDEKPINYARVAINTLVGGKIVGTRDTIRFEGVMNPFIVLLAIPATFAALAAGWRAGDRLAALGACWCLGTYLPFLIGASVSGRVSYLYYMLIVMPGLYIVTTRLFASRRMPRAATVGWAIALIYGFIHLYPLRTLL